LKKDPLFSFFVSKVMDWLFFWSVLFQIIGVITVARSVADLSWDEGKDLDGLQKSLLFTVLALSTFDTCGLIFYVSYRMSRKWSLWMNFSQLVRIVLVTTALSILKERPSSPTNAFYAAFETVIYAASSFICRSLDYLRNGSSVGKKRMSPVQRTLLIVLFWNGMVMLTGAMVFKFVEKLSFSDSWNFIHVTALTIGYGNIFPRTTAGKIIIVTFGYVLVIMAGYFIVTLKDVMEPSKMQQKRNLTLFIIFYISYSVFGATVFMIMEDWSFIDSIYFVWKTLSTVGYGNIVPARPISWEFWLLYVYIAVALWAFALGLLTNALTTIVTRRANDLHLAHGDHVDVVDVVDAVTLEER
jgi:hypothetical protein